MSALSAKLSTLTADQTDAPPASPLYAKLCYGAAKIVGVGMFCSNGRRLLAKLTWVIFLALSFVRYITGDRLLTMPCKLICGFIMIKWSGEVDYKFGAIAAE
jgi:hypothetical protein